MRSICEIFNVKLTEYAPIKQSKEFRLNFEEMRNKIEETDRFYASIKQSKEFRLNSEEMRNKIE